MGKFRYMSMTDRIRLEEKIKAGKSKQQAADELGFHVSTIYRELKRGVYEHLNSDYTTEIRYSPDIADERYRQNLKAKGASIKLDNDYALAGYIETKIADEKYSPGTVLGEIKRLGLEFSVTLSKPTLTATSSSAFSAGSPTQTSPRSRRRKRASARSGSPGRPPERASKTGPRKSTPATPSVTGRWTPSSAPATPRRRCWC